MNGRAGFHLQQNIQHAVAVLAPRHAHHHLVALFNHVVLNNGFAYLTAQAFFEFLGFTFNLHGSPCSRLHADSDFAVVKNFQFGDFHPNRLHPLQLHQAVAQFANHGLQQIDMLGSAFIDDDLPHLAVIEDAVDVVGFGQQRLCAQAEFGIHLNRLGCFFFVGQNAQVCVKAQASQ